MIKFEELNRTNSTIIEVEGREYRTTQDPYINDDGSQYQAHAVDVDNNEYIIVWEVTNAETEDESEACNWDEPLAIHTA